MSHAHMMIWSRDGRMREFEAFSCDDVDSIHNDYQRVRGAEAIAESRAIAGPLLITLAFAAAPHLLVDDA